MITWWRSRPRWASSLVSATGCLALLAASAAPALAQSAPEAASAPVSIDIPSIGAHAQVVPLGLDEDGTLQSPSDPDTVGWYAPGAAVGAPGNAVIDGHVDWGGRLRAFGFLKQLESGDEIRITDAAGDVLRYSVGWSALFDADNAPIDAIFEQGSIEEVTLITCGGAFDRSTHMYLSRWVVRAARITAD